MREAALAAGAKVLENLLGNVGVGRRAAPVRCGFGCGRVMESSGIRLKTVHTLLGPMRFERSRYRCPACGKTRYPGDEALDIGHTSRSPGVRRQTARLGAKEPFREVARDLRELAGIELSRKDAERVAEAVGADMERWDKAGRQRLRLQEPPPPETLKTIEILYIEFDGTGVPMVRQATAGRTGKQGDGSAKTREAKIGCAFTQTAVDEKGRPIRDPGSTSFTGAIETAAEFGWRIYAEAVRRGLFEARRVVVISDGAEWIRKLVETHFPGAIHIIDLYHAREHLLDLCRALFDRDLKRFNRFKDQWWHALDLGHIERLVQEATQWLPKDEQAGKDARREIAYFEKNAQRMRYQHFKEQELFLGSGVVEAACRTIVGERLKKSGMEWTVRGADAIIALRCMTQSGRLEDYWEQRAA